MNLPTWSLVLAGVFAAGCAETVPRNASAPYDVLRVATQGGAGEVRAAAPYLQAARDQIDLGNTRRAAGDLEGAAVAFMCAEADARLAVEITRRERVLATTRALEDRVSRMNALVSAQ